MATRARQRQAKPGPGPMDWESLRTPVTEELLAGMTRRIVDAFHPQKIILFGSYAYGTPHIYSDVDLLVVMESEEPLVKRSVRVYEVAEEPFVPMDVLVFTPAELLEQLAMGDSFVGEITRKGRVLYADGHA